MRWNRSRDLCNRAITSRKSRLNCPEFKLKLNESPASSSAPVRRLPPIVLTTNMAVHCQTAYASCMNPQAVAEVPVSGWSDLIAFDRPFIANPDLHARIASNWPLNPVDPTSL